MGDASAQGRGGVLLWSEGRLSQGTLGERFHCSEPGGIQDDDGRPMSVGLAASLA